MRKILLVLVATLITLPIFAEQNEPTPTPAAKRSIGVKPAPSREVPAGPARGDVMPTKPKGRPFAALTNIYRIETGGLDSTEACIDAGGAVFTDKDRHQICAKLSGIGVTCGGDPGCYDFAQPAQQPVH